MEKKSINLVNNDASEHIEVSLYLFRDDKNKCIIKIICEPNIEQSFIANDFFESFVDLRKWIYKWKLLYPMCKGALINVYPSKMSRQMSDGLKAYSLSLGKQADEEMILDIFDSIGENEIKKLSTPSEQNDYFKKWIRSL